MRFNDDAKKQRMERAQRECRLTDQFHDFGFEANLRMNASTPGIIESYLQNCSER